MISRRSTLHSVLALLTGSALAGTAAGRASSSATEWPPYDPGHRSGPETTIAMALRPEAVSRAPLPNPVAGRFHALADRYGAVSVDDFGSIRGALAVDETRIVGGGAIATAAFDTDDLVAELTTNSFVPIEADEESLRYYRSETAPVALGVDDSTIAVGYDATDRAPDSHVKAVAGGESTADQAGSHRRIAASIDAGSLATATLGSATRSRLLDRIPGHNETVASVIRAASGFGAGLEVGRDRSTLTYAADLDVDALSLEAVWDLTTTSTEASATFDLNRLDRRGRIFLAQGTVRTDQLWAAQEDLFGVSFESGTG